MEGCPFCDPKQRVLKENTHVYVLLSNPRKVVGTFLVIPKRHVEKPWEFTEAEAKDIFDLVLMVQKKVAEKLSEGVDIRQHYRPFVKEGRTKVNHIHYHVLPRTFNDALHQHNTEDELWEDLSPDEHDRIAEILE
jgi:diadenosine tetraphosphate (Ap4A) HIT family hydrolase